MAGKCHDTYEMQTKYSDVITFYSIISGYCCSLDPPLLSRLVQALLCFSPLVVEPICNLEHKHIERSTFGIDTKLSFVPSLS